MGIGFQNPTAQTFESFDAWSQWLGQQPKDVQEAFSGLEGTVHVPSRERFDQIISKVKSYQIFLKAQSQMQNVGWGGSGLFVSNAKTAMQNAVSQAQTGQVKSFSKPQFELGEPLQNPSEQCQRLRDQILPIYQDCLNNAQTAVTRQHLNLGGPEGAVIRPATLSLFGSYVAALVDDCGVARGGGNVRTEALIQNLKKYCGPDTAAHADAILKNFKTVTYKTSDGSEIPLEQLIKNNLSRFQRALQMDTSKAVVTGMQGLPNNVMLVLEDLVQRGENHILNQLQTIDNGSAMNQIAGKMEAYTSQIEAAIQVIEEATDQDDVFALMDLFPNEQAQAYLYAQIGIDQRLLKLKSKPPQVSDEQWEFHQNFKEAKSDYEVKGMVVSGMTAAGMIFGAGMAGLFPPLAPFLLAGMATMTVGFAAYDVSVAEDQYTLSDVSHLASQQDGNPVLAEEKEVLQAERNVNHAVAKAPAEVVLAVAGMGTAMRIHQASKLSTGAKILLDMGAGGAEAAMATSANWQHYDEGTMGQQMKMSFAFGLGGSLVGEGFSRGLKYGVKGTRFDLSPKVDANDAVDDINDVTEFLIEENPDVQVIGRRAVYEAEVTESDLTDPMVDRLSRDDFETQELPEDQVFVEVDDPRLLDGLDGVEATRDAPIGPNLRDELFDFSSRGLTDRLQEIQKITAYSTLRKKIAECKQALAYGSKNNLLTHELPFEGESDFYLEHWTQVAYALRRQSLVVEDSGQINAKQAAILDESLFGLEKNIVTAQKMATEQVNRERNLYPEKPVTLEHGFGDRYKPQAEDKLDFDDLTDGFVFHRPDHNTKPTSAKLPSVLNEISKLQPGEIQNHIDQTYLVFRDVLDFHDGRLPVLMDQFAYGPFPLRTFSDFQQCYVTYRRLLQSYKDKGQIDPQAYDQAVTSLKHMMEDVMESKVEGFVAGEDGKHAPDLSKHLEEEIDGVSDLLELEEPMPGLTDDLIADNPAIKVEDKRDDIELTEDMLFNDGEDLSGPEILEVTDKQLQPEPELNLDPSATRFIKHKVKMDPDKLEKEFPEGMSVRLFDNRGDLDPRTWKVMDYSQDGRVILISDRGGMVQMKKVDVLTLRASQRVSKEQRLEQSTFNLIQLIEQQDNGMEIPVSCVLPDGREIHGARVKLLNVAEQKALVDIGGRESIWLDADAILPEQALETDLNRVLDHAATGMLKLARRKVAETQGRLSEVQWNKLSTGRRIRQGQTGNCFMLAVFDLFQNNQNFKALLKQSVEVIEYEGKVVEYRVTIPLGSRFGDVIEIDPKILNQSTIDGDPIFKILEYVYVDLACREQKISFNYDILKKGGLSLNVLEKLFGNYFRSFGHLFNTNGHHLSLADLPPHHTTRGVVNVRLNAFRRDVHFLTAWTKSGLKGQGDKVKFPITGENGREYQFYHKHAYSIAGVVRGIKGDLKAVKVVNPHDTSKTIRLPLDVFMQAFNGVSGGKFNDEILLSHLDRGVDPLAAR